MTTRRPRARRSPGRSQRRKVSWENLAFNLSIAGGVAVAVDLTPEPMQTVHLGVGTATVRRSLLHFDLSNNLASTSSITQFVSFGIAVVSEDALAALALPDPESDFNQDWLYWTRRAVKHSSAGAGAEQTSWDSDIRSMRRLRGGYRLVGIAETPMNALTIDLHISARFLWSQEP